MDHFSVRFNYVAMENGPFIGEHMVDYGLIWMIRGLVLGYEWFWVNLITTSQRPHQR